MSWKNEMLIFGLCSASDDWPSDESQPKCKKRPRMSWKNEMLIFGLCSTSDDQPSDHSDESQPKCKNRPPKSSENEVLIFGLCSNSDDQPSDPSNESQLKCKKGPLSHQKWNAHFWIMFNFWWLAEWSEWWKSTEMQKRPPKSSKNVVLIFGLCSTSDDWPLCWSIYRYRVRLQDWLHSGDEFPIAFKVNYMSEDLLLVTVTSRWICDHGFSTERKHALLCILPYLTYLWNKWKVLIITLTVVEQLIISSKLGTDKWIIKITKSNWLNRYKHLLTVIIFSISTRNVESKWSMRWFVQL